MRSRFYRIGVGIIFVLIIAGFVLPGVVGVVAPKTKNKHLARIDGESINEQHFCRLLTLSVQRLQMFYPKITFPELVQMNYPTDMLRDFVRRQIMRKHMEKEGFLVNEKSMVAMLKKQLAGRLPESRSERRILLEDARIATLLDQLILPYAFPQDYIKLQLQALSIQRQFDLIEIFYDRMVVEDSFSAEKQKEFENSARKKYGSALVNPKRKDVVVMVVDPTKVIVSTEEAREFFEKNKSRYQNAAFEAISKQVVEHAQHEKVSAMINDIKIQLDQEKSTIEQLADLFKMSLSFHKKIDDNGDSLEIQKDSLPVRDKMLENLSHLDEEDYSVIVDDQKPGYFYVVKVLKVYPEHPKTGSDLLDTLKKLWVKEQQQNLAQKLANDMVENKDELSGYVKKYNLSVQKNLSISARTEASKYPVKDLNPDMVDRLLTAPKDALHMEYGKNSILLFDIIKDTSSKSDDQSVQKQKKVFEQMANDSVTQAWFNDALVQHKVEINISALHDRLNS